jgi:signal transduction histidine kinase/tetratricopeptide (TPR) repeat protein
MCGLFTEVYSQGHKLDSLWNEFRIAEHDTTRIILLNEKIGEFYRKAVPDSAIAVYGKAIAIAEKAIGRSKPNEENRRLLALHAATLRLMASVYDDLEQNDLAIEFYQKSLGFLVQIDDKANITKCLNNIGVVYYLQGNYEPAIEYFNRSVSVAEELNDKMQISRCYNNIGNIMQYQGNYDKAIDYYHKSLKIKEELNDLKGMALCLNNIGVIHRIQKNYPQAIEYYQKSLKIAEDLDDKLTISRCYNNIGSLYHVQGKNDQALEYYLKALKISEEIGNKHLMIGNYNNIGLILKAQGNYSKAIEYFSKTLKFSEDIGDKNGMAMVFGNIASLNTTLADSTAKKLIPEERKAYLLKAVEYGNKAFNLATEINALPLVNESAAILMQVYFKLENYRMAYEFSEIFISTKDSMYRDEKTKSITEIQTKYETEKKQQEIEKQQLIIDKQEADNQKQRVQRDFFIAGSILLALLALLAMRGYQQKKRSNSIISEKSTQLEKTNKELHEKNVEIEFQRNSLAELNAELHSINEEILAQKEELERTQKQLIQSEKMASIGVLTAGIAHEINNPVNFVYAGVNSLKRDFADIEWILHTIDEIETKQERAAEIVKQIIEKNKELDFGGTFRAMIETMNDVQNGAERTSKIVEGLREFSRSEQDELVGTNINRTIDGVLLLLQNKFDGRIEVRKDFDPLLPEIECKPGKINQVIMNLVANAIDAIRNEGVIEIATRLENRNCIITVKDNGEGIPEKDLAKIFDPFFTTKPVGKGVGLGLSIAYAIVQEHNGAIEVSSTPEVGTEIIVTIPERKD